MEFRSLAHVASFLSTFVFLLIFGASAPSAQTGSATLNDANALFVSAVLKYREAEGTTGSDAERAYREVRRLFDLLLLEHPDSRPAEALLTEQSPGGVDLRMLPALEEAEEPDGWNTGKRAIARDLLISYRADLERIESVAASADFAALAAAAYADSYTDSVLARAAERGWTMVWRYEKASPENPLVGAATAILFRSDRGTHVLSFRGSKTAGDWVTNINGSLSVLSLSNAQVDAAREISREVVAAYPETIFVGHSLGGRLAQVARLATGNAAVVFNTAPLGANDRLRSLSDRSEPATSLLSFRSPEDPLTSVFSPSDVEVSNVVLVEGGGLTDAINLDYTHSMDVLAEAMQAVRLAEAGGWIDAFLMELRARDLQGTSTPPTETGAQETASSGDLAQVDSTFKILAGEWRPVDYEGWTFRIEGFLGKVATGGDSKRPEGSEILRLHGVRDRHEIVASWTYTDGVRRSISATLRGDVLTMTDGTNTWSWAKLPPPSPEEKRRLANALPEDTWANDPSATSILKTLRGQSPVGEHQTCGELRGPLSMEQIRTLFERRWLSLVDYTGETWKDIVARENIGSNNGTGTIAYANGPRSSHYELYMCGSLDYVIVGFQGGLERQYYPHWIVGVDPVPREPWGEGKSFGEAHGRATAPIPIAGIPGCTTTSLAIEALGQLKWSGSCKDGMLEGEGVLEWWDQSGELRWKTFVGPRYWTRIDDRFFKGRVVVDFYQPEIFFELTYCGDRGSIARVELPRSLPKEIYTARNIVFLLREQARMFAEQNCEGKPFIGASIFRGDQEKPDVHHTDYADNFSIARVYEGEFLREGRDIKTRERRAAIERQADARKSVYERDRMITETYARAFLKNGNGTLETIISALELDEISTVQRLEKGVTIELEPSDNMRSAQLDGKQVYSVSYSVVSPFERLERQLKIDLANMNYTSQLNLIFDMSANPIPRRLRLTCAYSSLSDVPKEKTAVRASLSSYSSGRDGYSVSANCRQ